MWQELYRPCFTTQASCWVPSLTAEVRHCSLPATSHGTLPEDKTADGNPFHFCFSSFTHLNFQGDTDLWPREVIGKVNYVLQCWVGFFSFSFKFFFFFSQSHTQRFYSFPLVLFTVSPTKGELPLAEKTTGFIEPEEPSGKNKLLNRRPRRRQPELAHFLTFRTQGGRSQGFKSHLQGTL